MSDALFPPQNISHYRIEKKLASGGMGDVYLAEDLHLHRKVTLKFLSSTFTQADRIARLEREAIAASSLNHPNILVIHELGNEENNYFMAMEFVEGETLRQRLSAAGNLSVREAVEITAQLLTALVAAHSAGILHRDIKPENIMVRPDGFVKVLDFGLAKIAIDPNLSVGEQATMIATTPGMVLGTVPYMSPEQARGYQLDARSDLFSTGVVLYEMLTGVQPFEAATVTDTLSAILHKEPPPATVDIPDSLDWVITKALQKDRDERYQSAKEMLADLRRVKQKLDAESQAIALPRLSQITFAATVEQYPDWSPDGQRIVFSREVAGIRHLFIKHLESGEEFALTQKGFDHIQPAWSPDGSTILFVRGRQPNAVLEPLDVFGVYEGGDIWAIDLNSRRETKLIENAFHPSYSPDGKQIAYDSSLVGARRIWMSDARGHNPLQISTDTSEELVHIRPRWSPDGNRIVFQNLERTKFDVRIVEVATRKTLWLTDDQIQDINPVWSPSGKYIYFSSLRTGGMNIWRIRVAGDGRAMGSPQQLTAGAGQDVELAISRDGKRLAFSILKQNADLWRMPIDPQKGHPTGPPESLVATTREDSRGAWSPDGKRVAFNSDRLGEMNIWIHSIEDASDHQLTRGQGGDYQPNWSPDQSKIVFFSSRSGTPGIWEVECHSGTLRCLTADHSININPFYSPDGTRIAYQSDQSGRPEVWVMDADGTNQRQITQTGCMGHFLRWTPDGDGIYFRCPYGSQPGIYLTHLDGQDPEWFAEAAGGSHISFSPDQKLLLDVIAHKTLWISPMPSGKPRKIFEFPDSAIRIDYPLWSPDGNWFLFDRFEPQGGDIWMMENFES
jgi:Tol biopolymer transport system component